MEWLHSSSYVKIPTELIKGWVRCEALPPSGGFDSAYATNRTYQEMRSTGLND